MTSASASLRPREFCGTLVIEWPAGKHGPLAGGWLILRNGDDGTPILAATGVTVHAGPDDLVWAEVTMFAGEDGQPLFTGMPVMVDGQPLVGTFPFLVAEMRTADAADV